MTVSSEIARVVQTRAGARCEYCRMHQSLQGATFHVEHIIPRCRGGRSELENLAWCCPSCNLQTPYCSESTGARTCQYDCFMSIYATIGQLGLKRFDSDNYVEIFIQAVPPHIVDVGPQWDFLPPPVDPDGHRYRAVFFIERGEPKGTARSHQEYLRPLLKLTGQEYHDIRFVELEMRLEDALDARYRAPAWKSIIPEKERRWYVD